MTVLPTLNDARKDLRIGDLAKASRKTARALRLYEEMGLLTPGERTSGGFRLYGPEAIERVRWIAKLQDLGLSLNDIADAVKDTANAGVPREAMSGVRRMFEQRYIELTAQVTRLERLKTELRDAIAYLDGCAPCGVTDAGASNCVGCSDHAAALPELVKGVAGAAADHRERQP